MRKHKAVKVWKRCVRTSGIVFAGWILTGLCANLSALATSPLYSVVITAEESTVKPGDKVFILIKLTNESDSTLSCTQAYEGLSNLNYRYDVRDENGKSMKKEDIHPELMPGDIRSCDLEPGQIQRDREQISWRYDLSKPGKYAVQVARPVDNDPKDDVKSNILTITVVQ